MWTGGAYRPFLQDRHFSAASSFQIGVSRGRRMTPLVDPKTFKLKLLKEFRQGPPARKSRRLIGGKATAFDPHAHRFASPNNLPAPRRRIGRLAGRHYVIARIVPLAAHSLQSLRAGGLIAPNCYRSTVPNTRSHSVVLTP